MSLASALLHDPSDRSGIAHKKAWYTTTEAVDRLEINSTTGDRGSGRASAPTKWETSIEPSRVTV